MNAKHTVSFLVGLVTAWTVTWMLLKWVKRTSQSDAGTKCRKTESCQDSKTLNMGMRKFSEREQRAIQRMIDGTSNSYSYVLFNAYNDICYSRNVEFQYGKYKSHLVFYRADVNQVRPDELLEIENEIMEISLLISYLQANGLIYLIEKTSDDELDKVGGFIKEGLQDIRMELDSNIAKILYDSLNHRVFVGYTLRELAANGYMSIEERTLMEAKTMTQETRNMVDEAKRQAEAANVQASEAQQQTLVAKKQTRLSILALLFSIASVIISVCASIGVAKFITMDVKIDSTQVEAITTQMKQIEERIDSVDIKLQCNQDKVEKAQAKKSETVKKQK